MLNIRYILLITFLLFYLGVTASECEQKQGRSCTLYQAAKLQLMEDAQLVIYSGNWISLADVHGSGQLVMRDCPNGIIDGNGFAISNLQLEGSDIALVSPLYIVDLLQLKNSSHLVLNNCPLYLLPTASLVADAGSGVHTHGAARIIRMGYFHQNHDVVLTQVVSQFFINSATVRVTKKPVPSAFQHRGDATSNFPTPFICPPSPPPKV